MTSDPGHSAPRRARWESRNWSSIIGHPRRLIPTLAAFAVVLAACAGTEALSEPEAQWCRRAAPPFKIIQEASDMGIDVQPVMDEAQIAYDLEGIIGADPIAQFEAFYAVAEADDRYVEVCRALYETYEGR